MLVFKRKSVPYIQRNSFYFGISFIPFVVLWTLALIFGFPESGQTILFDKLLGQPITLEMIWPLIGILIYFLIGLCLWWRGYLTYPGSKITKKEIRLYNACYQAQFKFSSSGNGFLLLLIFISLVLTFIIPLKFISFLPPWLKYLLYGGIFLIFTRLFFQYIGRLVKKNNQTAEEVYQHASSILPQTKIENQTFTSQSLKEFESDVNPNLKGTFKGRAFELNYLTKENDKQETGILLKIHLKNKEFFIDEKKKAPNPIKDISLDKCFMQRFVTKGISTKDLPNGFKEALLNLSAKVSLSVKDGFIFYQIDFSNILKEIMPFYSPQGVILFLDFMCEQVKKLENTACEEDF